MFRSNLVILYYICDILSWLRPSTSLATWPGDKESPIIHGTWMGRDADPFSLKTMHRAWVWSRIWVTSFFFWCIASRLCPTIHLGAFFSMVHVLSSPVKSCLGSLNWNLRPGAAPTEVDQCLQLCLLQHQRHMTSHDDRAMKAKSICINVYIYQ